MKMRLQILCALLVVAMMLTVSVRADTYVIPFSDIQQIIDSSDDSPDSVIRAYLAGLIRDELDALGFDVNGGLVIDSIPVDEITKIIETDCPIFRPYEIHTDATTATVSLDDGSGLTIGLGSISSIALHADLVGTASTQADAWVRWGQNIIFVGDCIKINTDHGWVGLTLPFDISLDLDLELAPRYDSDLLAIVVDKQATLSGQAQINGGTLQHDFGTLSLTDLLINLFEEEMLSELRTNGEQAVIDAISRLNLRLDGLDENGAPDPTIVPFNGPSVFALQVDEEDESLVRDLLAQLGIPNFLIEMLDDRGIDILLQLAILEGAEREAYLAELGATASCDVLLAAFETPLDSEPIYSLNGPACEVASVSGPDAGEYFADMQCSSAVAFRPTDVAEFCLTRFGGQANSLLGNAAAWVADSNQPNDPLPGVPSLPWTTTPSTQLDLGAVSLAGNHQPYMKQLNYKTVTGLPRGNGSCELEMRVYKNDIAGQNLKPLMALHGGTWRHRGSSFFGLEAGVSQYTERGFIVFAPFYRLVGDSDGNVECNSASWREITADVEGALDWIREYGAALGAADGPVSVYGQSAGAHLAAWLAAHRPGDISKALLYYGPTDALSFLSGATPVGGPYEAYRKFGLKSLSRLYGAKGSSEVRLDQIDYTGLTVSMLAQEWSALIPATVFDLTQIDPSTPPVYLARCADMTQIDLSAISLAAPPMILTECLKQDLSEFLIENSFNHLLSDEAVPIHAVHGTVDSLVPYEQALDLCEAIDANALPATVVEPLTQFSCGNASQVQIIKDADHAFELGVCFASLCPAGEPGSLTRDAVVTAINDAYLWLLEESINPTHAAVSVLTVPDVNSNGSPDIAILREDSISVEVRDGQTGALISNIDFLGDGFKPISVVALPDTDGNGVAEIGVLASRKSDGRNVVEMRNINGPGSPRQVWYAAGQTAVAMSVIDDDADGNGVAELAVLTTRDSDGRIAVSVKNAFGATNPNTVWYMSGFSAVDVEVVADKDGNGVPEIAVLASRDSDGRIVVDVRNARGATNPSAVWFMAGNTAIDLVTVPDKDMNGIPEVAVLSSRNSDGRNVVEIKNAMGATLSSTIWSTAGHTAHNIRALNDADSNGVAEVAVLTTRDTDGQILVEVKNVIGATNPNQIWYSSGYSAHGLATITDTDGNGVDEALVLMIRDSDGRILVQGRNAAGNPAPIQYWFSP